jgi:hypothetical protein
VHYLNSDYGDVYNLRSAFQPASGPPQFTTSLTFSRHTGNTQKMANFRRLAELQFVALDQDRRTHCLAVDVGAVEAVEVHIVEVVVLPPEFSVLANLPRNS